MEGFEVITSDDAKAGRVVDVRGDNLIVEHGTIFKSRHAVPQTFAHVDEAERVVRVSVSKQIWLVMYVAWGSFRYIAWMVVSSLIRGWLSG